MIVGTELRVLRAAEIAPRPQDEPPWLIEGLWGAGAVGMIGGAPKSCKSWLSLEIALAVASGRPCLGRFRVPRPGPALVFAAEDTPLQVRERLEGLSLARGARFPELDVGLIVEPSLRIDRPEDLDRLRATVDRRRPKLLVLDPYVRLQRVDENNSTEVSRVLGALRELSREFGLSIVLVHHARKGPPEQTGQALRGSSDFHAWGDSNLYLGRRGEDLALSIEHRAAQSPPPLRLRLLATGRAVRLEIQEPQGPASGPKALPERVLDTLALGTPRRQEDLRALLRVRNQRLTEILHQLERDQLVHRTTDGWCRMVVREADGGSP